MLKTEYEVPFHKLNTTEMKILKTESSVSVEVLKVVVLMFITELTV